MDRAVVEGGDEGADVDDLDGGGLALRIRGQSSRQLGRKSKSMYVLPWLKVAGECLPVVPGGFVCEACSSMAAL